MLFHWLRTSQWLQGMLLRRKRQQLGTGRSISYLFLPRLAANLAQLSSEHVQLLEAFYAHQICDWKSDAEYLSDSFVVDFHPRLDRAYTKIKAATHNSHVTASTTDQDTIEHALAIENLRVQIDISNSLRGIFKTLHRRDAYSSLSNGKLELKRGYPTLPPRVGPDALPQRFFLETGQVDGIKRSAPGSDGKDAGGGKKPKTK
ncbi:hypothetical protein BFJ70_g9225 [Fusarium oxysporum]|nr:hypothetical protein BFJ70_g9225 [Fusarium oxysporum]